MIITKINHIAIVNLTSLLENVNPVFVVWLLFCLASIFLPLEKDTHLGDVSLTVPFSSYMELKNSSHHSLPQLTSLRIRVSERSESTKGCPRLWSAETQTRLQIWSTKRYNSWVETEKWGRGSPVQNRRGEAEWLYIRTGSNNQLLNQNRESRQIHFTPGTGDKLTSILNGIKRVLYVSTHSF